MNVPKLRFKEFSGEWERVSFGKFFDFLQTNSFSREIASSTTGTIRNIHYGDILTKLPSIIDLNEIELPFLDSSIEMKNEVLNKSIIKDGDIVIADTAEDYAAGMTCEVIGTKEKAVLSGLHTMLCRKKGDNLIALGYLGYYMNTPGYHNQLLPLIVGSKVYSINKNEIKKTVLSMPEFVEQEKIVDLLRTVDKKINSLKKSIDLLNKQKKGFMQKIFSQELRFKDDKGEEFPAWEEKKLGEVGVLKNGIAKGKEFFGTGKKFINLQDVFGKTKLYFNDYGLVEVTDKELEENNLRKGDVLFVRSSVKPEGVGLSCVVMEDLLDTVFSGFIIRCRFSDTSIIDINYSTYCFLESNFRTELLKKSSSSANTNINQDNLANLRFKLPCIKEQQKIAEILSALDAKIELENQKLEHWQQIKKGLLQQMFV